jgi:OmcA/MtrC family decaheme c-type cytochrome
VSYNAAPPTGTAPNLVYSTGSAESAGTSATSKPVVDNGDGTYSYTFYRNIGQTAAAPALAYDATKLHRFVAIVYASGTPFAPINVTRDFKPSVGITDLSLDGSADVFDPKACLECHGQFRATAVRPGDPASLISAGFHGGNRYDPRTCVACHNDQRRFATLAAADAVGAAIDGSKIAADGTWKGNLNVVNGEAYINMPVFIHKIHYGEDLSLRGGPYTGIDPRDVTYPQDVRNCAKCHRTVARAANWNAKPSRRACNACHDGVSFAATVPAYQVAHTAGPQSDDTGCAGCHSATAIQSYHVAIAAPSADATWLGGTNANTNAGCMPAAGSAPAGMPVITYDLKSASINASGNPVLVFKLKKDGVDVAFGAYNAATNPELITGADPANPDFVGSPSAYFIWALPQDGIATPADFNTSASGWLRGVWAGSVAGATLTGPDTSGYYTVTLGGTTIPATATMFQGGVGYTYSLSSTQPLTYTKVASVTGLTARQKTLCAYKASTAAGFTTKKVGGLVAVAPDKWVVGTSALPGLTSGTQAFTCSGSAACPNGNTTGTQTVTCTTAAPCACSATVPCAFAARRTIVAQSKCLDCHTQLGANPSFHAGQRNDGPTCAWCHRPNQTSSGWSANAKDFIHGIHGASKRSVRFTWHAAVQSDLTFKDYGDVTYPGVLNLCTQCHVDGAFDLSNPVNAAAVPSMLPSTVGVGRYLNTQSGNPLGYWAVSPYVVGNNLTDYGYGYSTSNVTRALPDGISGTQGATSCTPAAPCTCTTASPCSVTIGSAGYTFYNMAGTVTSDATTPGTACTDAAPCTCTTNPASGPKTSCTALFATCSMGAPCNAQGTTLIKTPIVSACSACHDTDGAIDHMKANGGGFYESRASYAARGTEEQCLLCHGPGKVVDISMAHIGK